MVTVLLPAPPAAAQDSGYDDVSGPHAEAVAAISEQAITEGCTEDYYCPDQLIRRDQMASFLARALDLDTSGTTDFSDVPDDNPHAGAIAAISEQGITEGCDAGQYSPRAAVQRQEMASFLARALDLPATDEAWFHDVDGTPTRPSVWVQPASAVAATSWGCTTARPRTSAATRWRRSGPSTREALALPEDATPRSTSGYVAEFDEDRQIVMLVDHGSVEQIFHASGGDESTFTHDGTEYWAETPNGSWDVYRQIDGWRESHLGELYRPKYFHTDGIAFHGFEIVPAHAASHGGVRVSIEAMDRMWANDAMPIGTDVLVYGDPS